MKTLTRWFPRLLQLGLIFALIAAMFAARGLQSGSSQTTTNLPYTVYLPMLNLTIAPGPHSPPLASNSYYFFMRYYTPEKARALGCQLGTRDAQIYGKQESLVILAFGIPKVVDGKYGASGMMVGGFVSTDQIAEAVQQFGIGYWTCTGEDYDSTVRIGIGTNNYNNSSVYKDLAVTYEHGKAWAEMVNKVASYFLTTCPRGCDNQVSIVGASDIELAWSSPTVAYNWVRGYSSVNRYPLYNFGAAEGCPNACGGGGYYWTRDEVWRVTNAYPVYPLPEIYRNDGRNAEQWYQLSAYAAQRYGYPYQFVGALTTYGACQQVNDPLCDIIDNTPQQGWQQLYDRINGSNSSTWHSLRYSTDIRWSE